MTVGQWLVVRAYVTLAIGIVLGLITGELVIAK